MIIIWEDDCQRMHLTDNGHFPLDLAKRAIRLLGGGEILGTAPSVELEGGDRPALLWDWIRDDLGLPDHIRITSDYLDKWEADVDAALKEAREEDERRHNFPMIQSVTCFAHFLSWCATGYEAVWVAPINQYNEDAVPRLLVQVSSQVADAYFVGDKTQLIVGHALYTRLEDTAPRKRTEWAKSRQITLLAHDTLSLNMTLVPGGEAVQPD